MSKLPSTGPSLSQYLRQQKRLALRQAQSSAFARSGMSATAEGVTTIDGTLAVTGTQSLPTIVVDGELTPPGILAGYVGEWNSSLTYEVDQSVTRCGYLYRCLLSNIAIDPTVPPVFTMGAAQSTGTSAYATGGTASGEAAGVVFTPTATITVNAIRYYGYANQAQTFRVGIASAIGATPAEIVWLAFIDGAPLNAGMNIVNLPSSVTLTGGVTYYFLVQTFNGGDIDWLMCDYSGSGSLSNLSSASSCRAFNNTNSWAISSSHVSEFEVGNSDPRWVQVATVSNDHTVDGTGAIPTGGTTGQVLAKASAADRDIYWASAGTTTATDTVAGIVELATSTEAVTGTDTVRATTPAGVKAAIYAAGVAGTGVAYSAGWADYGGGFAPVTWYKDKDGYIRLTGLLLRTGATITAGNSGTIFTLPVGARPVGGETFITDKENAVVFFSVAANGAVNVAGPSTWTSGGSYMYVSGVMFRAA